MPNELPRGHFPISSNICRPDEIDLNGRRCGWHDCRRDINQFGVDDAVRTTPASLRQRRERLGSHSQPRHFWLLLQCYWQISDSTENIFIGGRARITRFEMKNGGWMESEMRIFDRQQCFRIRWNNIFDTNPIIRVPNTNSLTHIGRDIGPVAQPARYRAVRLE